MATAWTTRKQIWEAWTIFVRTYQLAFVNFTRREPPRTKSKNSWILSKSEYDWVLSSLANGIERVYVSNSIKNLQSYPLSKAVNTVY